MLVTISKKLDFVVKDNFISFCLAASLFLHFFALLAILPNKLSKYNGYDDEISVFFIKEKNAISFENKSEHIKKISKEGDFGKNNKSVAKPKNKTVKSNDAYDQKASYGENLNYNSSATKKYLYRLYKYLHNNLIYPPMAKDLNKTGLVIFLLEIDKNGYPDIKNIKFIKKTGIKILDEGALKTIKENIPFPKPPFEKIKLKVPIKFEIRR